MRWIVFFDGECGLCSRSVRFLAHCDRRDRLRFAPLQGELAAERGLSEHADDLAGSLVVFREAEQVSVLRSDGVIELGRALGGAWRLIVLAKLIPRSWRDALYRFIARRRKRLFSSERCPLSSPEVTRRMLE